MLRLFGFALIGVAAASAAGAETPVTTSEETVIPFVSSIGSIEWQRISDRALYLRGGKGEWYVVRTMNRCTRLRSALGIGLQASAGDQLDRHGAVIVQGVRCGVESITRSDGPPRKMKLKHKVGNG